MMTLSSSHVSRPNLIKSNWAMMQMMSSKSYLGRKGILTYLEKASERKMMAGKMQQSICVQVNCQSRDRKRMWYLQKNDYL